MEIVFLIFSLFSHFPRGIHRAKQGGYQSPQQFDHQCSPSQAAWYQAHQDHGHHQFNHHHAAPPPSSPFYGSPGSSSYAGVWSPQQHPAPSILEGSSPPAFYTTTNTMSSPSSTSNYNTPKRTPGAASFESPHSSSSSSSGHQQDLHPWDPHADFFKLPPGHFNYNGESASGSLLSEAAGDHSIFHTPMNSGNLLINIGAEDHVDALLKMGVKTMIHDAHREQRRLAPVLADFRSLLREMSNDAKIVEFFRIHLPNDHEDKYYLDLETLGGRENGFHDGKKGSDVDSSIIFRRESDDEKYTGNVTKGQAKALLHALKDVFERKEDTTNYTIDAGAALGSASVPVVKFTKNDGEVDDGADFDCAVYNVNGRSNTELFRAYNQLYATKEEPNVFQALGLLVKKWSKKQGIVNLSYVSSYGWNLMVLYFLQQNGLMPYLQIVVGDEDYTYHSTFSKTAFREQADVVDQAGVKRNHSFYHQWENEFYDQYSLPQLFVEFCEFYLDDTENFYQNNMIDVVSMEPISKTAYAQFLEKKGLYSNNSYHLRSWFPRSMFEAHAFYAIRDPFEDEHVLAPRGDGFTKMREAMRNARNILKIGDPKRVCELFDIEQEMISKQVSCASPAFGSTSCEASGTTSMTVPPEQFSSSSCAIGGRAKLNAQATVFTPMNYLGSKKANESHVKIMTPPIEKTIISAQEILSSTSVSAADHDHDDKNNQNHDIDLGSRSPEAAITREQCHDVSPSYASSNKFESSCCNTTSSDDAGLMMQMGGPNEEHHWFSSPSNFYASWPSPSTAAGAFNNDATSQNNTTAAYNAQQLFVDQHSSTTPSVAPRKRHNRSFAKQQQGNNIKK